MLCQHCPSNPGGGAGVHLSIFDFLLHTTVHAYAEEMKLVLGMRFLVRRRVSGTFLLLQGSQGFFLARCGLEKRQRIAIDWPLVTGEDIMLLGKALLRRLRSRSPHRTARKTHRPCS